MATGLLETGPKLDWTRDNKIFDRYQIWKEKVELIFSSALEESSSKQKVSYLRYWMGEQGIPLVKKWTALGNLTSPVQKKMLFRVGIFYRITGIFLMQNSDLRVTNFFLS